MYQKNANRIQNEIPHLPISTDTVENQTLSCMRENVQKSEPS